MVVTHMRKCEERAIRGRGLTVEANTKLTYFGSDLLDYGFATFLGLATSLRPNSPL